MDILIIGGFLGAGKTRFIKAMAHATGRQFVVVENEFGALDIDSAVLRDASPADAPKMEIRELTEGCICCSMGMDFSLSVLTIANTLRPDYLLVEPSGVALPGRIVDGLRRIVYEGIGLLAPVTIVDAAHFRTTRRDYEEWFADQLHAAGTVALSRSEGMGPAESEAVRAELALGPDVSFPLLHYDRWLREERMHLLETRLPGLPGPPPPPPPLPQRPLTNMALRGVQSSPGELAAKLEALVRGWGGRVVRAKGLVPGIGEGEWIRFDVVDGSYEIASFAPGDVGEMVIIGEQLDEEGLHELFGGTPFEPEEEGEHDGRA